MKRSDCSVLFAEFPADHRSAAPLSRQDSGGIDCHQSGRIRRSGRAGWHDDRARSGRQDSAIEEACLDQAGAHPIRSGRIMPVGKPDPDTPPPLPPSIVWSPTCLSYWALRRGLFYCVCKSRLLFSWCCARVVLSSMLQASGVPL